MTSIINIPAHSDFTLHNFPFGIARNRDGKTFAASRIGDHVIDLHIMNDLGFFGHELQQKEHVFNTQYLNDFIALGKPVTSKVRQVLIELFSKVDKGLHGVDSLVPFTLIPADQVEMLMPVRIGDYTDFYSSIEHATNVGIMFRDPANALLPNWKHIPVGYHGRASSIVTSGTPIHRPKGQTKPDNAAMPVFGPTTQLDFELEMAFIIGKSTSLGQSIPVNEAEDHIFGMVIFNDLSARDIQKWEYVPLGPFLSKNFGSVISPWIVTMDALEPFRTAGPVQEPEVLPYLQCHGNSNFNIQLEVLLKPQHAEPVTVCLSNHRHLYWSMSQQLAHHTVNGCNMNIGDIYASGTISGPTPGSYGSMLELAWKGTKPMQLPDGSQRTFIEDYDTIIMKAHSEKDGIRVGFGVSSVQILPAL